MHKSEKCIFVFCKLSLYENEKIKKNLDFRRETSNYMQNFKWYFVPNNELFL